MAKVHPIACDEALAHLFEFLDHELDEQHHREMEQHLRVCRACFSRVEFEKALKQRLFDNGREQTPPGLQERIRKLLAGY
jgi:anti-sigma factor (TIGR02949 family)